MASLRRHLPIRLFWLSLMGLVGVLSVHEGIGSHSLGRLLAGIGLILLGVLNFLEPLRLRTPAQRLFSPSRAVAIGSDRLRLTLSAFGFTALMLGALLKLFD